MSAESPEAGAYDALLLELLRPFTAPWRIYEAHAHVHVRRRLLVRSWEEFELRRYDLVKLTWHVELHGGGGGQHMALLALPFAGWAVYIDPFGTRGLGAAVAEWQEDAVGNLGEVGWLQRHVALPITVLPDGRGPQSGGVNEPRLWCLWIVDWLARTQSIPKAPTRKDLEAWVEALSTREPVLSQPSTPPVAPNRTPAAPRAGPRAPETTAAAPASPTPAATGATCAPPPPVP